jgi:hypothetical protein
VITSMGCFQQRSRSAQPAVPGGFWTDMESRLEGDTLSAIDD